MSSRSGVSLSGENHTSMRAAAGDVMIANNTAIAQSTRPGMLRLLRTTRAIHHKSQDRIHHRLGFVATDRMAAVLEDAQVGAGNQPRDLLGEFRWADPVMPSCHHQRRRSDARELR